MQIIVNKSDLLFGVNTVNKAVPNRTNMPILECILFKAQDGRITALASDLEITIKTIIDGEIKEEGTAAIDAKMLTELVRRLPDGEKVKIDVDEDIALIKCKKVKANIPCKDGAQYPETPNVTGGNNIDLKQIEFKNIIRQTAFSADMNSSNRIMSGELFKVENGNLKVTTLDGHRIAIREISADEADDATAIIPVKSLLDISKVMSDDNGFVEITLTDNHAIFSFNETTAIVTLIAGDFFRTDNILNMNTSIEVKANRKELLESIDRATLFISEADKKPVVIDISDNILHWSIQTGRGSMSEDMAVEKSGDDIKIAFSPTFLKDTLQAISEDEVTLYLAGNKQPCLIKGDGYIYVVLPVNIG